MIKWHRMKDGVTESHCGEWIIEKIKTWSEVKYKLFCAGCPVGTYDHLSDAKRGAEDEQ